MPFRAVQLPVARPLLSAILLLASCTRPPCQCPAPSQRPCPAAAAPGEQVLVTEEDLLAQARFEIAKQQDTTVDWSVLAHHPNPYVRASVLGRLLATAGTLTDAQLEQVLELGSDSTRVFSPRCAPLMTPTDYIEEGMEVPRGRCSSEARTIADHASAVLEASPPDRVIVAIVASRLDPRHAVGRYSGGTESPTVRLAAAKVAPILIRSVVDGLQRADGDRRDALLLMLTAAPAGSGKGERIDAVVELQGSNRSSTATLAAAAVLLLTDTPDGEAAPGTSEPRKTAVRVLREALTRSSPTWLPVLTAMGPASAPLLDTAIDRMRATPSHPDQIDEALRMTSLVGAMGARGRGAAPAMIALAGAIAAQKSAWWYDFSVTRIYDALAAVGAPPGDLAALVLAQATTLFQLHDGTRALVAVHAALSPSEIDVLDGRLTAACPAPPARHHGGKPFPSDQKCGETRAALDALRGVAK